MNKLHKNPFVFVLMSFSDEGEKRYKLAIKPACEGSGAICKRNDELVFHGKILQEIYTQIEKADVIIADISEINLNILYEVGYAHGIGKNTILIASKQYDIPSDLSKSRMILHGGSITKLKNELDKALKPLIKRQNREIYDELITAYPSKEQRTVAIVFGDIVGFTSIISNLGELDLSRFLKQYLDHVTNIANMHNGNLVKSMGDSFLAMFDTTLDALSFSREIVKMDIGYEPLKRPSFYTRIGIYFGSVLLTRSPYGADIIGEAVVFAARLSSMAKKGEILLSETALNSLPQGYVKFPIEGRMVHLSKGFPQSIVYVIEAEGEKGNESQ